MTNTKQDFKNILGPLSSLLDNDNITEIMINGKDLVFVEQEGKIKQVNFSFKDDNEIIAVIQAIFSRLGRRLDESNPYGDARLPDGSRVNAVISPLAVRGPSLTIRKFSKTPLTFKELIKNGTISEKIAYFLRCCVHAKINFIVSGGTGSGKTTLLNVLSSFIPTSERLVTIEDTAELKLIHKNIVSLEARIATPQFSAITIRDLVRNSLRMRPDRIIVGESRGPEVFDMFQAMNTGHEGSMTTVHANSPRDTLIRLESLILMTGMDLPIRMIRKLICSSLEMIIQINRIEDGSRKLIKIIEIGGMEGDTILTQDIYTFNKTGTEKGKVVGEFKNNGFVPARILKKFQEHNVDFPADFFDDAYQIKLDGI